MRNGNGETAVIALAGRCASRAAALAFAGVVAAGCAAFPSMPKTIYDLTAPRHVPTPGGTRAQILVPEPSSPSALDNNRIAGRPDSIEYAYLPDAVWSDRLPKLLQARLMETLQNSDRVRAVGLPGQGLLIDYQIVLDLRAFEIVGDQAYVAFSAKLLNDRNGSVVATRTFEADVPMSGSGNSAAVLALDAAMDEAFISLTDWMLRRI